MPDDLQIGDQVQVRVGKNAVLVCRVEKKTRCRYCGVETYWVTTPNEKPMMIDPPNDEGQIVSHWGTCPFANEAHEDARKRRENRLPGAGL